MLRTVARAETAQPGASLSLPGNVHGCGLVEALHDRGLLYPTFSLLLPNQSTIDNDKYKAQSHLGKLDLSCTMDHRDLLRGGRPQATKVL